jgi:hypothetical protein
VVLCVSSLLIQLDKGLEKTFDERRALTDKRHTLTVRVCADRTNAIV